MCGAPAEAATSRSPVASITTLAEDRLAAALGVADHALDLRRLRPARARTTSAGAARCRLLATISSDDALPARPGRTRRRSRSGAACPCCGSRRCPSASSGCMAARASCPIRAAAETRPGRARPCARSSSMQMPRTEISLQVAVPHVVEHQHHAARGQAAEVVVALEQRHARRRCAPRRSPPPCRPGRRRPPPRRLRRPRGRRARAPASSRRYGSCYRLLSKCDAVTQVQCVLSGCQRMTMRSAPAITSRKNGARQARAHHDRRIQQRRVEVVGGLDDHRADALAWRRSIRRPPRRSRDIDAAMRSAENRYGSAL